jgi:hypothetical protein
MQDTSSNVDAFSELKGVKRKPVPNVRQSTADVAELESTAPSKVAPDLASKP